MSCGDRRFGYILKSRMTKNRSLSWVKKSFLDWEILCDILWWMCILWTLSLLLSIIRHVDFVLRLQLLYLALQTKGCPFHSREEAMQYVSCHWYLSTLKKNISIILMCFQEVCHRFELIYQLLIKCSSP